MTGITEIKRRIEHNTLTFLEDRKVKGRMSSEKYYFADASPGDACDQELIEKKWDLFASIRTGGLCYLYEKTGADGIVIKNNKIVEVEFKSSATPDLTKYFKSRNGVTHKMNNKNEKEKRKILSDIKWSYTIHTEEGLKSKDRLTIFLLVERGTGETIFAKSVPGKHVIKLLENKKGPSIKIPCSDILQYDDYPCATKVIGWHNWLDRAENLLECF